MMQQQHISFDFGEMALSRWRLPEVQLGLAKIQYSRQDWHHTHSDHSDVQLHFGLKGDYDFKHKQLDRQFSLQAGHYNLMYSEAMDLSVYNRSLEIETFGVRYSQESFLRLMDGGSDALSRFCEGILEKKSSILYEDFLPLSQAMERNIREIQHSPYQGRLQEVFLLSKSLELLVLQVEAFEAYRSRNAQFIRSDADKKKLQSAKEIVRQRLQNPLSLGELAKEVGINEYKLKKGFKELFGTTVFAYLAQLRLENACRLLRDTQQNVKEIAYELGYASPQHFQRVFKQQYGVTPGQFRA
ncbi:MAG: helix-turn-helix transcriptional regulator [Bacteroidota bacterium]